MVEGQVAVVQHVLEVEDHGEDLDVGVGWRRVKFLVATATGVAERERVLSPDAVEAVFA